MSSEFFFIFLYLTKQSTICGVKSCQIHSTLGRHQFVGEFICPQCNATKRGHAMALTEAFLEDEIHPIDIVEDLAEHHEWEFDRIEENQIAMVVQGQWRTYSITLAWSDFDETLRLICSFEMEPPEEKLKDLYETLNVANDRCWTGAFTFWEEQKLMVYRYGLVLTGGQIATAEQIDTMISSAVVTAEKYYPAFQLVIYDNQSPISAMQVAIAEAYGHA